MSTTPPQRSVKIDQDERGGWSSDRPRSGAPRPANLATRCRVLRPAEQLRYSPGSLLLLLSAVPEGAEAFADRLIEERNTHLSLAKIRALLAGRVAEEEVEAKARELLDATVAKRMAGGNSVALAVEGLEAEARAPHIAVAAANRRPVHAVLLETGTEAVSDEDRPVLNRLRTQLDAGGLGAEGFSTALRLSPGATGEVKRVVFRPANQDD